MTEPTGSLVQMATLNVQLLFLFESIIYSYIHSDVLIAPPVRSAVCYGYAVASVVQSNIGCSDNNNSISKFCQQVVCL